MFSHFSFRARSFWIECAKVVRALAIPVIVCAAVRWLGITGTLGSSRDGVAICALTLTTTVAYLSVAKNVSQSLVIREHDLHFSILLYVVVGALFVLLCAAFGWVPYDLVQGTDAAALNGQPPSRLDGLYFSTVTFTTLGYGDFVPRGSTGRWLAMFEAALGTAHSVFFVLVFLKGGAPTPVGRATVQPACRCSHRCD